MRGEETTVLLPLAPYVAYRFRVSAVNEVGRSQPSPPSERHETPPAGRRLPRRFPRGGVLSHKEKSTKVARACWGFRGSLVQRGRATGAPPAAGSQREGVGHSQWPVSC